MSHNTTSWQSHRSTGRWHAGQTGRSPAGGKARRSAGSPAAENCRPACLPRGAAAAQPSAGLGKGPGPTRPGHPHRMAQGPAAGGHLPQLWPWRGRRQVPARPLHLPAFAWHGARAEPPARRSGGDAMRVGRPLRAACGPGPPQGSKLFVEDPVIGRPLPSSGRAPPGGVQAAPVKALGRTRRDEGRHAGLVEGLGLLGRSGPEMWPACGRGPRHRRGDGGPGLARQGGAHPRAGALHARPAGRPAEEGCAGGQGGGECRQCRGTGFRATRGVHRG